MQDQPAIVLHSIVHQLVPGLHTDLMKFVLILVYLQVRHYTKLLIKFSKLELVPALTFTNSERVDGAKALR